MNTNGTSSGDRPSCREQQNNDIPRNICLLALHGANGSAVQSTLGSNGSREGGGVRERDMEEALEVQEQSIRNVVTRCTGDAEHSMTHTENQDINTGEGHEASENDESHLQSDNQYEPDEWLEEDSVFKKEIRSGHSANEDSKYTDSSSDEEYNDDSGASEEDSDTEGEDSAQGDHATEGSKNDDDTSDKTIAYHRVLNGKRLRRQRRIFTPSSDNDSAQFEDDLSASPIDLHDSDSDGGVSIRTGNGVTSDTDESETAEQTDISQQIRGDDDHYLHSSTEVQNQSYDLFMTATCDQSNGHIGDQQGPTVAQQYVIVPLLTITCS